jgi:hypothetical protein
MVMDRILQRLVELQPCVCFYVGGQTSYLDVVPQCVKLVG